MRERQLQRTHLWDMGEEAKKRRLARRKSMGGSAQPRKETEAEVHGDAVVLADSKKKPAAICRNTTQLMGIVIKQWRSPLRHSHHGDGARRREEHAVADASVQRGLSSSWQRPHTGPTSEFGLGRMNLGPTEARCGGRSGKCCGSDGVLEAARRHEHGFAVRPCQILQGRSNVPIRSSSHHSVGRQVRRRRPRRERAATAGSRRQVRPSAADTAFSRTPAEAGHPTRQLGSDEATLRAVSAWLSKRRIRPRSPRWLSLARSEAVQRLVNGCKGELVVSFSACGLPPSL